MQSDCSFICWQPSSSARCCPATFLGRAIADSLTVGSPFLARFDFETFFHRALLVAAIVLLWPFARSLSIRDLVIFNSKRTDNGGAILLLVSFSPPFPCSAARRPDGDANLFVALNRLAGRRQSVAPAAVVPLIEEIFFRGLVLGVLLKQDVDTRDLVTSALYSIVHFLKTPEQTSATVTWASGFNSIAHAFVQFADPLLVAAGFTTLFLIGWILADARLQTRSLWLPIGLHAGWILTAGSFNKIALRKIIVLPWLGKNLLVGIIPLAVALLTWLIMRGWLRISKCSRHLISFANRSLLYPPACTICSASIGSREYLCADCEAKLSRIVPPFCAKCSEPFAGAITATFSCAQLRASCPLFRCRGLGLSQPRHRSPRHAQFQIRAANSSSSSRWPTGSRALDDPRLRDRASI